MRKRIISILIALSAAISLIMPSAPVHAELGIKNELQVSLLAALNIVPGYPSSYNADAKVTAKDFVSYANRLIGMDNIDVSASLKAYGLDENSETLGALTAIKIIINVLGYDPHAAAGNNDYFALASQMGITKNADVYLNSSEPVTYDQMVMMFYNALNAKAVEMTGIGTYRYSDKKVMEYYLKIYEGSGVVNANDTVVTDGGATTGIGEVRIGADTYFVGNTITEHLIGSNVKFYYQDNNDKTLCWIESDKMRNHAAEVYGNDIVSTGASSVIYDDGKRNKTLRLDNNYLIVYNGKAVTDGSIGIDAVMSLNSQNYFIDNNNNGKYNIVIINDYEYYLADAISQDTYTVNDYSAKTSIELNSADRLSVYENGIKTTPGAIKQGSVIAVAKSADSRIITVQILNGLVTGEITSLSQDVISISGTEYNISPSYAGDALKLGRSGTFYFDNYGRIVRCVGLKNSASQYGFLLNIYRTGSGDAFAEVLTAEGTRETFTIKQTVSVNDIKCNVEAALQKVEKKQLITYNVNSDKRLIKINTPDKTYLGRDDSSDTFSMHFKGAGKYRKNNMCFNSKYLLDSTTPIFVIPHSDDRADYTIMDPSLLVNNTTYDISVYDIDEYMYPSCVVLKENFAEPENLRSKRSTIITGTFTGVDEAGEAIIGLEGYQQGGKVSYTVGNVEMMDNRGRCYVRDLKAGDVVQISVDANNDVRAVQLLFKAEEKKLSIAAGSDTPNSYWEGGTLVMPDLWVSYGKITGRNANVLLVDADGNDSVVSKDPHKFASATNVYVYENGKVRASNKNDIFVGDKVYVQEYQGNLHEVLIIR